MNVAKRVLGAPDKLYNVLPKSWASAGVRGVRAFISIVVATVIGTVADGSVFNEVHVLNPDQVPLAIAVLTPILLAFDKWLRDHGLEEQPEGAAPPEVTP